MRSVFDRWFSRMSFYSGILFVAGVGAMLYTIVNHIPIWGVVATCTLFAYPVTQVLVSSARAVDDGFIDGKRRRQELLLPPPYSTTVTEKREEPKQIARQRHPVKQLPPMGHKRPFATINASARPVSANGRSSPQAMRTPSGQTDGQDIADRRTTHVGQLTDGRTLDADSQADADKSKVLFYKQRYPAASVREVAAGVVMGKTKVGEIIQQLKREGKLQ